MLHQGHNCFCEKRSPNHVAAVTNPLNRRLVKRAPSEHPLSFADALAATQTASPVYEDEIAHESR